MKMIAVLLAAAMAATSAPALSMGQTQQIAKSNQPVPAADASRAAAFNACVSREYVAGRDRAIDNAMGKYRDEYTLVSRSVTAKNLPEFQKHLRSAEVLAADVGTSCKLNG